VVVDLVTQTITSPTGAVFSFEIDAAERTALVEGLDDIGVSLREEQAIQALEARLVAERPWLIHLPVATDSKREASTIATSERGK
jgi:3-isopropylmalate/(R)-2-methylmalate dehydratase small subunit